MIRSTKKGMIRNMRMSTRRRQVKEKTRRNTIIEDVMDRNENEDKEGI
jgi:hypothetical protein